MTTTESTTVGREAATLLMMPIGETPQDADFSAGDDFETYEDAVRAAHARAAPDRPFAPWIRFGGTILEPEMVMATNTPPAPLERLGELEPDRLDDELAETFPASDPPSRTQP